MSAPRLGTAQPKAPGKQLAQCKRCNRREYVWDRSPATSQRWRLYDPFTDESGTRHANLDSPHACTAPALPLPLPASQPHTVSLPYVPRLPRRRRRRW